MIFKTNDEAGVRCRELQREMNLLHWDVVVRIVPSSAIEPLRPAAVYIKTCSRTALIRLLNPADYASLDFPQDHEASLVHELEHIRLSDLDRFEPAESADPVIRKLWADTIEMLVDSGAKNFLRQMRKVRV